MSHLTWEFYGQSVCGVYSNAVVMSLTNLVMGTDKNVGQSTLEILVLGKIVKST